MKHRMDMPSSRYLEVIGDWSEYFCDFERAREACLQVPSIQPNLIFKVKRGKATCRLCSHFLSC